MRKAILAISAVLLLGAASCTDDSFVKQNKDQIEKGTQAICESASIIVPQFNEDPAVSKGLSVACQVIKTLVSNISATQFDTPEQKSAFLLKQSLLKDKAFESLSPSERKAFEAYVDEYYKEEIVNVE